MLLHIELTATHKEMAAGIGADKAAFVIEEPGTTNGTKLPPVFLLFFLRRFGSIHDWSPWSDMEGSVMMVSCNRIDVG
jgi:hypothetical protein